MAFRYNGNNDQAKKVLHEAIRMDPDNKTLKLAIKLIAKQEDLKEKGNEAFKKGNTNEAIKMYTEVIDMDPFNRHLNSILYANRAAAYVKQKKLTEALCDCNKAIEFNEKYTKVPIARS